MTRCTAPRRGSIPTRTTAWRAPCTPRWRSPGSPPSASSTTCTTVRTARAYAAPNAMGEALLAAAAEAGIRITLLDALYLHGGLGRDGYLPVDGVQRAFSDGSIDAWAERVGELQDGPAQRIGAAIHSVRAVDPAAMTGAVAWAASRDAVLHVHASEQPDENEACLAVHGRTPDRAAGLGRRPRRAVAARCTPRTSTSATSPCWPRPARRCACARRPSATSATASARPPTWPPPACRSPSARTPTP